MPTKLDAADRRLLNELQANCRRSLAELAEAAGLSLQTCQRRVQALRDSGLILAEVALVDPQSSPRPLTVLVEVKMEKLNETTRAAFEKRVCSVSEILQCWAVSGEYDYLLVAQVADIQDYYALITQAFVDDERVRSTRSTFTIKRVKQATAIAF